MGSSIDATQPPASNPTTAGMRGNMAAAKAEIEALQKKAFGANLITVGSTGDFSTLLLASDYLRTLTVADWLTELVAATCTISNGSRMLTTATASALWGANVVRPGDQWSPDGVNFYTVRHVVGNSRVYLETPYLGTTIGSLTACAFYRPKFRGVFLMPGDHNRLDLHGESVPCYVQMSAAPGAMIVGGDLPTEGVRALVTVPRQGIVDVVGVMGRSTKDLPVFGGSSDSSANVQGSCIVRSIRSDLRTMNVDYFQPVGLIGRFEMIDSIGSFAQDGCLPISTDTTIISGSHLFGENTYNGAAYWHLRMFAGQNGNGVTIRNSTLELRHDHTIEPTVESGFFDPNYSVTYRAENTSFVMSSAGNANKMFMICNPSGLSGSAAIEMVNCNAKGTFAAGTKTIVQPIAWTGTASVTARNCDFSGFAIGGGGTLTTDIVAGKFNVL